MNQTQPSAGRIASIDALRGLTILVMIFVNDVSGVHGAPAWMKHFYPYDADGMTFVDIVFPAFLFIVGMSIPFAIGRRLDRGDRLWPVWKHILARTINLLIIGVFMVNSYTISKEEGMNSNLWIVLMYLGVILVWNTAPREPGRVRKTILILRGVGIVLLAVLALVYRGSGEPGLIEMRTQWWGILGLIGWAYLVACICYSFLRRNPPGLVGAIAVLYCFYAADRMGVFSEWPLRQWIGFGSMLGSQAAITVSGILLGSILTPQSPIASHGARIRWAFFYGLAMFVAGELLHTLKDTHAMWILNKNAATIPWCLVSSAITVWVWIAIYWLMDVRGWKRWAIVLQPAGENPLFAYILHPMLIHMIALSALILGGFNIHAWLGKSFILGFTRSVLFAFAVTWLAGAMKRIGVRLKL
jgi:predicted acyltransferase